jgi:16S rRNA C967 or C1407 C5-methylase (RsmB/RsmF family)
MADEKEKVWFLGEGNIERAILNFLKIPAKFIADSLNGNTGIEALMRKRQEKDFHKTLVGITDEDPKKITPRMFDEFVEEKNENFITLKKHPHYTNHYLIIIKPEFEKWLIETASEVNINMYDFDLPDNPKELKKITRKREITKNENFKNFLKEINQKHSIRWNTLSGILIEFKQKAEEY